MGSSTAQHRQIAANIALYRRRAGLTQRELADRLNCSTTYVSRMECGDRGISVAMLVKISEALEVSCDALLKDPGQETGIQNICLLLNGCSEGFITQVESMVRIMKNLSSME